MVGLECFSIFFLTSRSEETYWLLQFQSDNSMLTQMMMPISLVRIEILRCVTVKKKPFKVQNVLWFKNRALVHFGTRAGIRNAKKKKRFSCSV